LYRRGIGHRLLREIGLWLGDIDGRLQHRRVFDGCLKATGRTGIGDVQIFSAALQAFHDRFSLFSNYHYHTLKMGAGQQ